MNENWTPQSWQAALEREARWFKRVAFTIIFTGVLMWISAAFTWWHVGGALIAFDWTLRMIEHRNTFR